jgi:hypothetical protein
VVGLQWLVEVCGRSRTSRHSIHLAVNTSAKILRDPAALRLFFAQAIINVTTCFPEPYTENGMARTDRYAGYWRQSLGGLLSQLIGRRRGRNRR